MSDWENMLDQSLDDIQITKNDEFGEDKALQEKE